MSEPGEGLKSGEELTKIEPTDNPADVESPSGKTNTKLRRGVSGAAALALIAGGAISPGLDSLSKKNSPSEPVRIVNVAESVPDQEAHGAHVGDAPGVSPTEGAAASGKPSLASAGASSVKGAIESLVGKTLDNVPALDQAVNKAEDKLTAVRDDLDAAKTVAENAVSSEIKKIEQDIVDKTTSAKAGIGTSQSPGVGAGEGQDEGK